MTNEHYTDSEPIHAWFELTYASYLVLPRSVLQSAPVEWQQRFVKCLEELEDMFGNVPLEGTYHVQLKDCHGRFISDPLRDYQRGRRTIPMKKHDFVQTQNPKSKLYIKIDREQGKLIGHKKTPYKNVPLVSFKDGSSQ